VSRERYWVAECNYPGKRKFFAGNALAETELEAERALRVEITQVLPEGFEITAIIPGRIILEQHE